MSRIRNAWRALMGAGPEVAFLPAPEAFVEAYETRVYKTTDWGYGPYQVLFASCCEAHKKGDGEVTAVRLLKIGGGLYRLSDGAYLRQAKFEGGGA